MYFLPAGPRTLRGLDGARAAPHGRGSDVRIAPGDTDAPRVSGFGFSSVAAPVAKFNDQLPKLIEAARPVGIFRHHGPPRSGVSAARRSASAWASSAFWWTASVRGDPFGTTTLTAKVQWLPTNSRTTMYMFMLRGLILRCQVNGQLAKPVRIAGRLGRLGIRTAMAFENGPGAVNSLHNPAPRPPSDTPSLPARVLRRSERAPLQRIGATLCLGPVV